MKSLLKDLGKAVLTAVICEGALDVYRWTKSKTKNEETMTEETNETHPSLTDAEIERRFNYHRPDEIRLIKHKAINTTMINTAKEIRDFTPGGREQELAIQYLEMARMWANAAVACDPDNEVERRA